MATRTVIATGNFDDPLVWDTGIPGDGDDILHNAAFTVTINQNVGTVGNGIKQWIINHASAVVDVNSAAARNIYFASTGNSMTGGGSQNAPIFASATCFGFYVAKGTLRLKGTTTNLITIDSGNATNNIYIYHTPGALSGSSQNAILDIQYCHIKRIGISGGILAGLVWQNASSAGGASCTIDHCQFTSPYYCFFGGTVLSPLTFTFNYITAARGITLDGGSIQSTMTITDNTELAPTTSDRFLNLTTPAAGSALIFERNAILFTAGFVKTWIFETGGTWTTGKSVKYNYSASTSVQGGFYTFAAGDSAGDVYRNIGEGGASLFSVTGANVGGDLHENIARQTFGAGAQGNLVISAIHANPFRCHHNIAIIDVPSVLTANTNIFWYHGSGAGFTGFKCYHNTCVGRNLGAGTQGIAVGEGSGSVLENLVRDNICYGAYAVGITDSNVAASNTYDADYVGVGVHHNDVFGSTPAYTKNGGTNFDDGVHAHADAIYGDVTADPLFAAPWRTGALFDASVGGPGTFSHLFTMLSNRSGCTGVAYDSAYDIQNVWAWMWAGWQPTAAALHAASDNVSPSNGWIGAVAGPSGGGRNSIAAIAHTRQRGRKQRVCVAKRNRR